MLNFFKKIKLRRIFKYVVLSNLSVQYTWKNLRCCTKNIFKISVPTWNDKFELPDELYSVSYIQDYIEYITKKYEAVTDNPPIRIYVSKIVNRITFKIKAVYFYKHLIL